MPRLTNIVKIMKSIIFILLLFSLTQAQTANALRGYKMHGDSVTFIFDRNLYRVQPARVVVTGAFRGWSDDMNDQRWLLRESGNGIWRLTVANPDFSLLPPSSPFKFRIDDGIWLDPPQNAPNARGGNLIFADDIQPMIIRAELVSARDVRLLFPRARPEKYIYDPAAYRLTNGGREIAVERVLYIQPGELQLVPAQAVDIRRFTRLHLEHPKKTVTVRYNGWFKHLYNGRPLGAWHDTSDSHTHIRLFAPRADSVIVYLYEQTDQPPIKTILMDREPEGSWYTHLPGNWEGFYYDFTAHGPDEPGNHFHGRIRRHFSDPWARVSVDSWGPARIWPRMTPATPLKNGIPRPQDLIAYEVHVQDFTNALPLPDSLRGSFRGFVTPGLRNTHGAPIGFDHLKELGINAVHLMPVQEFLHYPDKVWQKAFLNDPYMIEQGINRENYQWGYRTSHAFALESRFRVKGSPWGSQNRDFRDLVQRFHDNDIAVIVDVVFNHTAERMDGRMMYFNFAAIDAPYFYRTDAQYDFIGAYGTETKSEQRPLMRRWIIEQVLDLKEQYGIDGIRIDLAGQTDEQTLRELRRVVGPDFIIYGEPWIGSDDPDYEANPDWDWYKEDAPIIFFQDDSRNAFKGPTSDPQNKQTDRGYAGGAGNREQVKKALSAGFPEDKTPLSGINYLDIHDNWALADRFATKNWDGRFGVDEDAYKIAATLLFTSPGPLVLHGGSEFMRSKGHAPLTELIKEFNGGKIWLHGKRDTYNLATANLFIWENLGRNMVPDSGIYCNYKDMNAFWRGLIALRLSDYGSVFRIAEKPAADYYRWIEPQDSRMLGYIVDGRICVLLNTADSSGVFNFNMPRGDWILAADNDKVDHKRGREGYPYSKLHGGRQSIELPPFSLRIWINKSAVTHKSR